MIKRLHLIISGQVQGVSFRFYAQQKAQKLNLRGFTRNLDDGGVEIVAEGEEDSLKFFLDWCRQGPPFAQIDKVEAKWSESTGEFKTFAIR